MSELHWTKGLPASGKSTWAKAWVAEDPARRARVNQDDLRRMLCLGEWDPMKEHRVWAVRHAAIDALLDLGLDVIADDTNLAPPAQASLRRIAMFHHAEFILHDFTDVPLDECIRRDAAREGGVGEDVIRGMYRKYMG